MNLKLSTIALDELSELTETAVVKHETATLRVWELPDGSAVAMTLSASDALLIEPVAVSVAQPLRSRSGVVQAVSKCLLPWSRAVLGKARTIF